MEKKESSPEEYLSPDKMQLMAENYDSIGKLYLDGYHVCHNEFGLKRDGECLFCVSLMRKE